MDERKRLKRAYKGLYRDCLSLLRMADPAGIGLITPNEYEPEVGTILPRLRSCNDESDVQRVLIDEFDSWFWPGAFYPDIAGATAMLLFRSACQHGVCTWPKSPLPAEE